MLLFTAVPLGACSPVSLTYDGLSDDPVLRDALWIVETQNFADALGGGSDTVESLWLSDVRGACEARAAYLQAACTFSGQADSKDVGSPARCDAYRTELQAMLESRPDTEWELTIARTGGGELVSGRHDLGSEEASLRLLHVTGDRVQDQLERLGEDCQGGHESSHEVLSETLVAVEGEVALTASNEDSWRVDLADIALREVDGTEDLGVIEGDFLAERCAYEINFNLTGFCG